MTDFLSHDFWDTAVPALLHSLWIGAILAGLLAIILRLVPTRRSNLRYGLGLAAQGSVVIGTIVAWAVIDYEEPAQLPSASSQEMREVPAAQPVGDEVVESVASSERRNRIGWSKLGDGAGWKPLLGWLWLFGVSAMLVRWLRALRRVGRFRRTAVPVSDRIVESSFEQLLAAMGIHRRIALVASDRISAPVFVGVIRPVIIWPLRWIGGTMGLSGDQVRAILAHELAHFRRHDYLVNLVQMLVEALLFFNPAVWCIGRQIRLEREVCCDAVAARYCEGPGAVAASLVAVAEWGAVPSPALGVTGGGPIKRVRRLLHPSGKSWSGFSWPLFLLAVIGLFGAIRLLSYGAEVLVANVLDGPEHIAAVEKIEESHGTRVWDGPVDEDDRVTVSGRIIGPDGQVIESGGISIESERPGSRGSYGVSLRDGQFSSDRIEPGYITVVAQVDGYAPASTDPVLVKPGEALTDLVVRLEEGFSVTVEVVDGEGQPLSDVAIDATLIYQNDHWPRLATRTDQRGQFAFDHLAPGTLKVEIMEPGYEALAREIQVVSPADLQVSFTKAIPLRGQVLSAETGEPISDAEIRLLSGGPGTTYRPTSSDDPADVVSGADGSFMLTRLVRDWPHRVWIEKQGYRPEVVTDVETGGGPLSVELQPAIELEVKLQGPLDHYRGRDG
ncbi:MAG: M56 family metallopeptidase, partial [Verrucomicrobiota bacterium]